MNSVTLPNSDASKFCRFCLSEINLLNVIGSSPKAQETHGEILRLAKTYLQLELRPDQDFPSAVCEMCIGLLYDFDKLYKNAQEYSYALRLLLQGQRRKMVNDIESEIPVNTIESMMDMYDPSPILFIDVDNNGYEEQLIVSNVFGGGSGEQITVEDVPIAEQNERQEAQIDVYHVDGQLQHIVMEGGTLIELKTEETPKPPANLQTTHLLNASHSKGATYSAVRKRSAAAPSLPVLPKKSVPTKLPSAVMCTPTRTLNVEASGKRRPAQLTGQQHSQSVGGVASKQLYRCNQCSNLFVELSNYYRHTCQKRQTDGTVQNSSSKQSAGASDGQRTQCKLCNMSYRTKLQYQKHEYEAHGIRNENFGIKCTICHKLFSQRQDYQLHMRVIHPMQGVSFVKIHG
ncbi:uncharacterized protein LOC118516462 [Anopheles stephensi]|uniref:uncharacterized protein LOC118505076 n=1 Tax=Anopheles stephensi TaxID=30069 RepID=UPI001658BF7F|nr:uncharacterized protein LOC118505076 [Anopheles stephensi]XP_035918255.1 uncharacterized protein LOC118516462 [Anopheles stephensi]